MDAVAIRMTMTKERAYVSERLRVSGKLASRSCFVFIRFNSTRCTSGGRTAQRYASAAGRQGWEEPNPSHHGLPHRPMQALVSLLGHRRLCVDLSIAWSSGTQVKKRKSLFCRQSDERYKSRLMAITSGLKALVGILRAEDFIS